jgi:type I restriction enzyme S subunit
MRLADVIDVFIAGDWGNESPSEETPNAVYCVRGADIVPISIGEFGDIPLRYVSDKSFEEKTLRAGDMIVEKSGGSPTQSTGRVSYVSEALITEKGAVVCTNFCVAFRVKTGWNPYFVYQYWNHIYNNNIFFNFEGKTSGLKNLQLDNALKAIEIPDYTLEQQNRIAETLLKIEQKVLLNRAINQNLEAMAKQLYDYWFVQFDFPDENGKPYKSSGGKMVWNEKLKREIPKNWHSDNICLIADILSGGTPSKRINEYWNYGHIPFFGPTDYNGSMFQLQTVDKITESGLQHCSSSLFEENTIIITARGSIGKLVIVGTPMAMNQSCYALKSKNEEYEYLYFLTIQLIESLKTKGSGSVFKSIIASDIENTMLCVANKGIISLFCDKVSPIMRQIKKNTQEMIHLTKQRDELLPLLMNGQVSVNSDLADD